MKLSLSIILKKLILKVVKQNVKTVHLTHQNLKKMLMNIFVRNLNNMMSSVNTILNLIHLTVIFT